MTYRIRNSNHEMPPPLHPSPSLPSWHSIVAGEVQTILAAMSLHGPPSWTYYTESSSGQSAAAALANAHGHSPQMSAFLQLRGLLEEMGEEEVECDVYLKPFLEVRSLEEEWKG